jgi:hypothetical protein
MFVRRAAGGLDLSALILTRFQPGEKQPFGSSGNSFNGFCCLIALETVETVEGDSEGCPS